MRTSEPTLHDVLTSIGWSHSRDTAWSNSTGRHHIVTDTGDCLHLNAHECWAELRSRGLVQEGDRI